jgi:3-oxoacyl-[acyl-carrier protein] reductase
MKEIRKRFEGKIVLVTGAAIGIGRTTALNYAAEGATVVVSDITEDELNKTAQNISAVNGKVQAMPCDISSSSAVDKMVSQTIEKFGRLDILVNNAGFLIKGSIEETTDELIDQTLGVNVNGVLYAIRAVTPHMKQQHYGRIINVASIAGKNGDNSTVFAYGAAKGAVISLTRSVARQLGPFGITCNAIAPHAVMTKMMEYWDDEKKKSMSDMIPVRRLGTEADMSSLIRYLSSDEASFITGETVNINGGYYMD